MVTVATLPRSWLPNRPDRLDIEAKAVASVWVKPRQAISSRTAG